MTCAAVPSVLQNGVVVYQNVKNAHELERIPAAAPVEVGAEHERMYVGVMLQRDPQNQRLYLHDVVTEKEFTTGGNGHLNTTGPNAANGELFTADILRNALNVKSRQLSTGRSIDELAGEDADTWRGVDTGRVTQENGLFRRDAGRPTHIKRACGIASQTLFLYMYDAILRRRLTSRRRCRSDRPCCRCSGPDSRRWYSAPPPWARPRPRSRSGASPWCHRRT